MVSGLRIVLALALVVIAAWVVAFRRARPDLMPLWLAGKVTALLVAVSVAAVVSGLTGGVPFVVALVVADVVAVLVAVRLWWARRWLVHALRPADAAREAARMAHGAVELAESVGYSPRAGKKADS